MMTLNSFHPYPAELSLERPHEGPQEDDQEIIIALERYLRRASMAQAHALPRWVMW